MNTRLVTALLFALAIANVILDRLIIPAMVLVFRYIEAGFAPDDVTPQLALAPASATPIDVAPVKAVAPITTAAFAKKPRAARRRKPTKQMLFKAVEAMA